MYLTIALSVQAHRKFKVTFTAPVSPPSRLHLRHISRRSSSSAFESKVFVANINKNLTAARWLVPGWDR